MDTKVRAMRKKKNQKPSSPKVKDDSLTAVTGRRAAEGYNRRLSKLPIDTLHSQTPGCFSPDQFGQEL